MPRTRLSKSLRKYLRKEKARIRREILDPAEQEKSIRELYQKLGFGNINKNTNNQDDKKNKANNNQNEN